jgi:hypothetical protein
MRNPSHDRGSSDDVPGRKKLPVSLCITNFNGAACLPWCLDADVAPRPDSLGLLLASLEETGAASCQPCGYLHDRPGKIHYDGGYFHYVVYAEGMGATGP